MPSFFLNAPPPPEFPPFPYTTLFRSVLSDRKASPRSSRVCGPVTRRLWTESGGDRKSTRLNSSHGYISYALFFFKCPAPPRVPPLSLHDALPICLERQEGFAEVVESLRAGHAATLDGVWGRSEEHTSELQSRLHLVCPLFF